VSEVTVSYGILRHVHMNKIMIYYVKFNFDGAFLQLEDLNYRADLLESYIERRGVTLPAGIMQQKVFLVNRGCRYGIHCEFRNACEHTDRSICPAFQLNVYDRSYPLCTI